MAAERRGGFSFAAAAAGPRTNNGSNDNNQNAPPRSVAPLAPFSLLRAPPAWECCVDTAVAAAAAGAAAAGPSAPSRAQLPPLRRLVRIPDTFSSAAHYGSVLCSATVEELNLRLAAATRAFHAARGRVAAGTAASAPASAAAAAAGGASLQRPPEPPPAAVERACRASGVAFYSRAELVVYPSAVAAASGNGNSNSSNENNNRNRGSRGGWSKMRRAFADEDDDDGGGDANPSPAPTSLSSSSSSGTFLQLLSAREPPSSHGKGDLFVLSTAADLSPRRAGAVGDRLAAPWVAVARASWHAPTAEGRLGVQILSCWQQEEDGPEDRSRGAARPPACLRRSGAVPVFALRACDAAADLACLSALSCPASLARLGALPALIAAPPPPPPPPTATDPAAAAAAAAAGRAAADAEVHARAAGLNGDQAGVLRAAAAWVGSARAGASSPPFSSSSCSRPPAVTVIHGPFGSGKSTLLVALVAFLATKAAEEAEMAEGEEEAEEEEAGGGKPPRSSSLPRRGAGLRVLVVSHTNAAVDRVLTGLLDRGFEDIVRVGPLRKMHRSLLPFSLHAAAASASTSASASSGAPSSSSLASATANTTAELQAMLRDATRGAHGPLGGGRGNGSGAAAALPQPAALSSDAAAIAAELARVKAGAVRARAAALCRAAVVGTTCVSAGALPGMLAASLASSSSSGNNKRQRGGGGGGGGQQYQCSTAAAAAAAASAASFDVAVVDEASQIAEPLAAASLAAGGARYVVVAGDPMQLPPIVASPRTVSSPSAASTAPAAARGLGRSLLSRLVAAGHGAHLLRQQYRCHPAISAVANANFYAGRLIDGVGEFWRGGGRITLDLKKKLTKPLPPQKKNSQHRRRAAAAVGAVAAAAGARRRAVGGRRGVWRRRRQQQVREQPRRGRGGRQARGEAARGRGRGPLDRRHLLLPGAG